MSSSKKVITENPILDELVYNGKILMKGCILKDQDEALANETLTSLKKADFFMACKESRVSFSSFSYTRERLSAISDFTDDQIAYYAVKNDEIPSQYRDTLLANAIKEYVNNYDEENNYYRALNGLPPYGTAGIYITYKDVDGRKGSVWEALSAVRDLPLHEWASSYIYILDSNGYLAPIKKKYSNPKYLDYLGAESIDLYTMRKASRFQCIKLKSCDSTLVQSHFYKLLVRNIEVYNKTVYTDAYKYMSDYYDKFIIIMIIIQTFTDMLSEYAYYIIRRDIFDLRTIKYLFESNGIEFFPTIPIKYQLTMVRNLNKILKYKSTDKNIVDICSLFGFDSITLFKYYILRDRNMTADGDYMYSKELSTSWNSTKIPLDNIIGLTYGNGRYIVISEGSSTYAVSKDLKTWETKTLEVLNTTDPVPTNTCTDILYVEGTYLLFASDQYVYTSLDASTWVLGGGSGFILSNPYGSTYSAYVKARGPMDDIDVVVVMGNKNIEYAYGVGTFGYVDLPDLAIDANEIFTNLVYGNTTYGCVSFGKYGILYTGPNYNSKYDMVYKRYDQLNIDADDFDYATPKSVLKHATMYYDNNFYCIFDNLDIMIHTVNGDINNWKVVKDLPCKNIYYLRYANNTFVALPLNAKGIYYSTDSMENWNSFFPKSKNVYWNCCVYGNGNLLITDYNVGDYEFYYLSTLGSNSSTSTDIVYNDDANHTLKFVKTPIDGDVLESLSNTNNIYKYYNIIEQDKYWEGDKTRAAVRQEIVSMEFNILRTKYYSLESITDLTEMTFQLAYFLNILMNNDVTSSLKVSLPFISNGSYTLTNTFIFLYALGYAYYGTSDKIMKTASNVLTIRSFNFEADLTSLSSYLANKGYDLNTLCGNLDFQIPESGILTYKQLMYIYSNNKQIYKHITQEMLDAENKDIYDIYKKIYDALFLADLNMANFSVLDEEGKIMYTYDTYTDYLYAKDITLYNYLIDLKAITVESERQIEISNVMNNVVSYIEETTSLMEEGNLEYIWSGLPTLSIDFIKVYIMKLINFFKSFKADFLSISTLYEFTDKFDNMIYWIDKMHFDYRFDKSELFKLFETIEMHVTMSKEDKVKLKDTMVFAYFYAYMKASYSEDMYVTIKDVCNYVITFLKGDTFVAEDIIRLMIKYAPKEDIYVHDKIFFNYLKTIVDTIGIGSEVMTLAPFTIDASSNVRYYDRKIYS